MSTWAKPTKDSLELALTVHGVRFKVHPRARHRDMWSSGLRGVVVHHTAGTNSVDYLANAWSLPGANCVVNKDGSVVILAWGSAWHSGEGGPWDGVAARNSAHLVAWGIEIEDKGTGRTINEAQIEATGRMLAALVSLGVAPSRVIRHADWTDGTGGVSDQVLPTKGRKIDTRKDHGYTTDFWRIQADKYARDVFHAAKPKPGDLWDGRVPELEFVMASQETGKATPAAYRVAARLRDLGHFHGLPVRGQQTYPKKAVANWQKAQGFKATGLWGPRAQAKVFGV